MPRNLDRRVEILFPVEDEGLKKEVMHILEMQLEDNVKAHMLQAEGSYERIDQTGKVLVNSQEYFCEEAMERAEKTIVPQEVEKDRVFIPAEPL